MKRWISCLRACLHHSLFFCAVMLATHVQAEPFHFAVLMHVMQNSGDENELRIALESAQAANPSFILVNGMRSKGEPCTDRLYRQRTALHELDPDTLSPREALDALYRLKKLSNRG